MSVYQRMKQTDVYINRPMEYNSVMVSANDVAAYILRKKGGPISAMKLQKLVYYCQAWSLVWDDRPMFSEPIEAWANGPVVPVLYEQHKGRFQIESWPSGDPSKLDKDARETADIILETYGRKNAQWLSDLTHREKPWMAAREGLSVGERGSKVISLESMSEYYSSLPPGNEIEG